MSPSRHVLTDVATHANTKHTKTIFLSQVRVVYRVTLTQPQLVGILSLIKSSDSRYYVIGISRCSPQNSHENNKSVEIVNK